MKELAIVQEVLVPFFVEDMLVFGAPAVEMNGYVQIPAGMVGDASTARKRLGVMYDDLKEQSCDTLKAMIFRKLPR